MKVLKDSCQILLEKLSFFCEDGKFSEYRLNTFKGKEVIIKEICGLFNLPLPEKLPSESVPGTTTQDDKVNAWASTPRLEFSRAFNDFVLKTYLVMENMEELPEMSNKLKHIMFDGAALYLNVGFVEKLKPFDLNFNLLANPMSWKLLIKTDLMTKEEMERDNYWIFQDMLDSSPLEFLKEIWDKYDIKLEKLENFIESDIRQNCFIHDVKMWLWEKDILRFGCAFSELESQKK